MSPRTSTSAVIVDRTRETERGEVEEQRVNYDTAEQGPEVSAILFIGEVCARAAMFGEEVDEAVDVGEAGRRGWWLHVTGYAPLDQIRV